MRALEAANLFFERENLSHAYLIEGNSEALREVCEALSKRILCDFGGIANGKWHFGEMEDLYVLDEEKIPIDAIRRLRREMLHRPVAGEYLVFVVFHSENMQKEAQNALLKAIEEPPSHVVWLLATQNLARILPTVRSRCQIHVLPKEEGGVAVDSQVREMVTYALRGELGRVMGTRSFYETYKDPSKQVFHQIGSVLEELFQKEHSIQLIHAMEETQRVIDGMAVNINRILAMEHLLLTMVKEAGDEEE